MTYKGHEYLAGPLLPPMAERSPHYRKDVDRHSTFRNQTVDPSRYFCIVTHITGLKKHNSHPSDITFRTYHIQDICFALFRKGNFMSGSFRE